MRITATKVRRSVRLLKDPRPQFVSLVDHGANQTPFHTIKLDEVVEVDKANSSRGRRGKYATKPGGLTQSYRERRGAVDVTPEPAAASTSEQATHEEGIDDMATKSGARVRAAKEGEHADADIHALQFSVEHFDEASVKTWLDNRGYADYAVEKTEVDGISVFTVPGSSVEEFESEPQRISLGKGVSALIGTLKAADPDEEEDEEEEADEEVAKMGKSCKGKKKKPVTADEEEVEKAFKKKVPGFKACADCEDPKGCAAAKACAMEEEDEESEEAMEGEEEEVAEKASSGLRATFARKMSDIFGDDDAEEKIEDVLDQYVLAVYKNLTSSESDTQRVVLKASDKAAGSAATATQTQESDDMDEKTMLKLASSVSDTVLAALSKTVDDKLAPVAELTKKVEELTTKIDGAATMVEAVEKRVTDVESVRKTRKGAEADGDESNEAQQSESSVKKNGTFYDHMDRGGDPLRRNLLGLRS